MPVDIDILFCQSGRHFLSLTRTIIPIVPVINIMIDTPAAKNKSQEEIKMWSSPEFISSASNLANWILIGTLGVGFIASIIVLIAGDIC